jgi:hypothetical protein
MAALIEREERKSTCVKGGQAEMFTSPRKF